MHLERGSRLALVAVFPVLVLMLAACQTGDDNQEVDRGAWGELCYPNKTCDPGLICAFVGNRFACVLPDNTRDATDCTPDCAGKNCGDNGCGGSCGVCTTGTCVGGTCQADCTPNCTGKQCGDNGCGGSCGTCTTGYCVGGTCKATCTRSCAGKSCGDDGCGGSCGTCPANTACRSGTCSNGTCLSCPGEAPCPVGWECFQYLDYPWVTLCMKPCSSGSCPADFVCSDDGYCAPTSVNGCLGNAVTLSDTCGNTLSSTQCKADWTCRDGECGTATCAACGNGEACPNDWECLTYTDTPEVGYCTRRCSSGTCPSGFECHNSLNRCVPTTSYICTSSYNLSLRDTCNTFLTSESCFPAVCAGGACCSPSCDGPTCRSGDGCGGACLCPQGTYCANDGYCYY